jgi:sugar phosphate isomerase/epimerase
MKATRREFLAGAMAGGAAVALGGMRGWAADAGTSPIRVGTCTVGLDGAKKAGLDGVQIGLNVVNDQLDISQPATRDNYKRQMKDTGLPICGLMMGVLNSYPLASDARGPAWLTQAIDAAKDLDAKVILVAFFGKGDLLDSAGQMKQADVDVVVKRIKDAAPRAKDAGVILAIENYLNVDQNLQILERINHESVQIYYDVYNTGGTKGYDVPAEIRKLKGRIAQFHFKNGPQFLDNGKLKFEPIVAAVKDIGYRGWIVLETSNPTKDAVADARRNGEYVRKLFAAGA